MFKRFVPFLAAAFLFACDSAEERAEEHFRNSVELHEAGDTARAIIELRNVLKLNDTHRDARMLMAEIEEERGNTPGAYGQYSAVVEGHPEDFEAQRSAARVAAELGDWEAAERHAEVAGALLAEGQTDSLIRTIALGIAYQEARRSSDLDTARSIAAEAASILETEPDLMLARRILIDDRFFREDWEAALAALDAGLAQAPDERVFYALRLAVLERLGRPEAIESQLREMVDRFADDKSLPQTLVRWYVSQSRQEDAESYLRSQIDPADADPQTRMTLVGFLSQIQGVEAALEEVGRILDETGEDDPNRALYRAARAGLIFDQGDRNTAIVEMQDIIAAVEPSDRTRRIKITLARMLVATGNPVGARALVEEVLEEDATEVEALKMRAAWMIEDDRPDAALIELRRALDQTPRDPDTLTLMAQAQERAGSRDLMGEMLALAVEASDGAPGETLRYAAFLVQEDRLLPAERVLVDALRRQPDNMQILGALGNIYVRLEDWSRTQGVIDTLAGQDGPEAAALSDTLTARLLAAQDRQAELQSFLEQLAAGQDGNNQAIASAIRLRLAQGDTAGALEYLNERLVETPDDPGLRLISVALMAIQGETDTAFSELQALIAEFPESEQLRIALYNLHRTTGDLDAAKAALDEALETIPDGANLKWALAGELERQGDIESAIAIYEDLYKQNTGTPVIANNLASLISSFREDEASLQRAYAIARRLRGTEVPQFQDTYGWIAARLGNTEEALDYLESAAGGLPDDPTVRYHLARTYAMLGRNADALENYRMALDLLQASSRPLPYRIELEAEIARLEAEAPAAEN